jgi:hypothetical protein
MENQNQGWASPPPIATTDEFPAQGAAITTTLDAIGGLAHPFLSNF